MGQFVGDNPTEFVAAEEPAYTGGDSDGGVLGITASREGVGGVALYDVNPWFGDLGLKGLLIYNAVKIGVIFRGDLLCVRHTEGQLVAGPVGEEVQYQGDDKEGDDPRYAKAEVTCHQKQLGENYHEYARFDRVHQS